jgi:hypothetical protein
MPAYYFHCTDGYELILDRAGRRMRSRRHAELVAHTVAGRVMQAVREGVDWSRWLVTIQDETAAWSRWCRFPPARPEGAQPPAPGARPPPHAGPAAKRPPCRPSAW